MDGIQKLIKHRSVAVEKQENKIIQ